MHISFLLHVGVGGSLSRDGNTINTLLSGLVASIVDADVGDARVRGDGSLAGGLAFGVAGSVGGTLAVSCVHLVSILWL